MKHSKIKLKWKIFTYLLIFTAILIATLWVVQTVYLDKFYKQIKLTELADLVEKVEDNINTDDIDKLIESVAKNYDMCIRLTDTLGNDICSVEINTNCIIHKIPKQQIVKYYEEAKQYEGGLVITNDDIKLQIPSINQDQNQRPNQNPQVPDRYSNQDTENQNSDSQGSYIPGNGNLDKFDKYENFGAFPGIEQRNMALEGATHIKVITDNAGTSYVLFANTIITPVDSTVYTIRIQLIFISIIFVILALILATVISYTVSKSIAKVNNSAKELAKGNYDVTFNGNDYIEIAELSDTLNYTAKELGRVEGLQKELIANVSHDLRTPLTMITAYSEVLRDIPGENTPENAQVIIDEAKRLTVLVNDLLDISKLQAGAEILNLKEYNLTEAIRSVIDRYAKLVEQNGYQITFDYNKEVMVKADEFKIYQVVYNLINNAINYTGEDKNVKVKQIVMGNVVRIEISDTGEGIPKEELKNVWERYYKVDKTHNRNVMGTGLGLSIVKNILTKHNARFGVDSELHKGSTFWFELETI